MKKNKKKFRPITKTRDWGLKHPLALAIFLLFAATLIIYTLAILSVFI